MDTTIIIKLTQEPGSPVRIASIIDETGQVHDMTPFSPEYASYLAQLTIADAVGTPSPVAPPLTVQ